MFILRINEIIHENKKYHIWPIPITVNIEIKNKNKFQIWNKHKIIRNNLTELLSIEEDMTIWLETLEESIAKVLEIILFRHKINSQKQI